MQTTQVPSGEITGSVLMYDKPEPLSVEAHGKLGLNRSERPFGFACKASAVPLQITEFGPASLSYPIIFAGEKLAPMVVMGLRPDENLFISDDGQFDVSVYVPAFIRRYPFVLAGNGVDDQLIVCIERSAEALGEGGEVALFENGQPSAYTQGAIKFCSDFEMERQRTDQFVQSLKALDIVELKQANFTPLQADGSRGAAIQLADYFAVDEEKLAKLDPDKVVELNRTGALRQIHCHLNSMHNWERLVTKGVQRGPFTPRA